MSGETGWEFVDDRGQRATAERRPERVVAYIQAAAALWDFGLVPAGHFGSLHDDGGTPDAAKAGDLPLDRIRYFGSGTQLSADEVLAAEPDLLVTVTYDGENVYGLPPGTVDKLTAAVPTVALGVSPGRELGDVLERFTALARSLGAPDDAGRQHTERLGHAVERLRAAAAARPAIRVLALSAASPDTAYLARPGAWPDLRALARHGVRLAGPPEGPGVNWATTGWQEAVALAPDIVLTDVRSNAAPPQDLAGSDAWTALRDTAAFLPWNPEIPGSALAHARFFDGVAEALERAPQDTGGR
ncbi:ABC transporter substrate-binding protein [Streptomyces sp. MP131-18]|uniref:ABC transporter substrate-binding protein n=1 Tax=Streptomyces sp. MP131-18 TaxID=1857892 RepID=UPI00097BD57F|nr:ABC transporter substrate-binding protein [Streptomyces sp. MP131-18]ONK15956.1 ABC-type Fe3+-citrate transport system, periplasmic component [Streptomyces sp. MP131-18]